MDLWAKHALLYFDFLFKPLGLPEVFVSSKNNFSPLYPIVSTRYTWNNYPNTPMQWDLLPHLSPHWTVFYGHLLRLENAAWGFRRGTGYISRSDFEFQLYNLLACCVSSCKLIKVSERNFHLKIYSIILCFTFTSGVNNVCRFIRCKVVSMWNISNGISSIKS